MSEAKKELEFLQHNFKLSEANDLTEQERQEYIMLKNYGRKRNEELLECILNEQEEQTEILRSIRGMVRLFWVLTVLGIFVGLFFVGRLIATMVYLNNIL